MPAIAAGTIALRLTLDRYVEGVQFIGFFPAVLAAAFLCVAAPGIMVALLCGAASWYLITVPRMPWEIARVDQAHALLFYFLIAPLGAFMAGAL